MLTATTADRLGQLAQGIAENALEMEALFLELTRQADADLARAAHIFIIAHSKTGNRQRQADYHEAHAGLTTALAESARVKELWRRATALSSKCNWWQCLSADTSERDTLVRVCQSACPQ